MTTMVSKKVGGLEAARQVEQAQVPISNYVPFALHLTKDVVKLKESGDFVATWRMHGLPFETCSADEILAEKNALLNFVHALRGSALNEPCALWIHRVRRTFTDRLDQDAHFPSAFAKNLAKKFYDKLATKPMFVSEIYFTLIMRPQHTASGLFRRASKKSAAAVIEFDNEALERFETLTSVVEAKMQKYAFSDDSEKVFENQCERLGMKPKEGSREAFNSDQLSFYKYLLTGRYEPVEVNASPIYNYLADSRIFAGDGNGIVQINHPDKRTFLGYMDLLDYPAISEPGMNNCLFYGDFEFIETQSFSFKSKRDGIDALKLQRNRMVSSGEASQEQIDDIESAVEDVKNGRIFMGEYHYTLAIVGDSVEKVKKTMASARGLMEENAGYKMAVVDVIPECAFFAQLPGNWKWRPRVGLITTRNLTCFAPMHNYDLGKRDKNPWGRALALFETPAHNPFYFNLHQVIRSKNRLDKRDPGNTFICGMTGTGKSVLLGVLITLLTSVLNLRILFFDKDRGGELLIRALRGRYRTLQRGQPTGFNPFQWEPTESNIIFVQSLIYQCALRQGEQSLSVDLENQLMDAVRKVFHQPDKATRRISAILQYVGFNSELGERLAKWCRVAGKTGPHAWVLDNAIDTTDFSNAKIFGFDYTEFLEDHEVGPIILSYILFAAETLINGQPFVYVMEEFAKMVAAKSQTIVEFARDKQTTIRKLNGLGIFVTQSPSQVVQYPIGKTLSEQCVTQIFLPNPRADYDDYVTHFKLDPTSFEIVKNFAEDSRLFLVKQGDRATICKLDLYGLDDELEILSCNPDTIELSEKVRAKVGSDDPDIWMPVFLDEVKQQKRKRETQAT